MKHFSILVNQFMNSINITIIKFFFLFQNNFWRLGKTYLMCFGLDKDFSEFKSRFILMFTKLYNISPSLFLFMSWLRKKVENSLAGKHFLFHFAFLFVKKRLSESFWRVINNRKHFSGCFDVKISFSQVS